ncbi:MAG TPA: amidohydrolase family protein [Caulobacteraceae bacterium]|jgi:N-acyl-D-aspartate/D-glutamate deacylase|nr:amidohydrolase family protein [Caulobacteraceae bacterium]
MMRAYDLVIRGGEVFDGSGEAGLEADVAVKDGVIAEVGKIAGEGTEEIDARGHIVTPGFVDIHTHYDGQATWDQRMQPSSWHGVTTVVMGNCGVGFAPCRADDHDRLVRLMEGVEDIPFPVLSEGLPWNWESYPDYLDALAARAFDVDIGSQLPHAALRVFVMGQRGVDREPATAADTAAMGLLARQAAEAGALGFGTSRTLNHRTSDGALIPTLTAGEDELTGIALGFKAAGAGVLQVVSDFTEPEVEFAMLRRVVERSGRPLSFTLVQSPVDPSAYKTLLAALDEAVAAGLPMTAQVAARAVGVLLGLELTINPFSQYPTWREIAALPLASKVARLNDPEFRARLLADHPRDGARRMPTAFGRMYPMTEAPDYEPSAEASVDAEAARRNLTAEEVALDHMLSNGGRGLLYVPFLNYCEGSLDAAHAMLTHPSSVPGLSDGGAHVGMICDGSYPTTMIAHWTRDRTRGPRLPLAKVISMQTRDTARTVGLNDRGLIAPGYRADLNVIDHARVALAAPQVTYDLPSGGRRLVQKAGGYVATILAGQVTYRSGEATGALPGRLVRGARAAPMAMAAE